MENIFSPKILAKVLENSKQKHSQIKVVCCECLLFALQSFPKPILDFIEAESFHNAIKVFVCESGKLKDLGKECFLAYSEKYPEKAEKIVYSIPITQKILAKELSSLRKSFNLDQLTEFPSNVEISNEE